MENNYRLILIAMALACLLFTGCKTATKSTRVKSHPVPCWLNNPVTDTTVGQVGIARDLDIGGEKPMIKSRRKALTALSQYYDIENNIEIELKEDTPSVKLAGHVFYFSDDFRADGFVYSYVQVDQADFNRRNCLTPKCQIAQCDPQWLCQTNTESQTALLGVSYLTTLPSRQQQAAVNNALLAAQFLYGVDIDANKSLVTVATKSEDMSFLRTNSSIERSQTTKLSHLVTHSCKLNDTLFARVAIDIPPVVAPVIEPGDKSWLNNPKYKGIDGAVGSAEKRVASGLFSDQLKLATKRAIVQLALEKESNLSEELLNIEFQSGGSVFISSIDENVQVNIKVKILGVHITSDENNELKVYTWVGRN